MGKKALAFLLVFCMAAGLSAAGVSASAEGDGTVLQEPVPECAPVDKSWFDDAVFIGDSVSLALQQYCLTSKALGNAQFLCCTSMNPYFVLNPVTEKSHHPTYQGEKVSVEEGVARCGAKNVYIMLGMNGLEDGGQLTSKYMVKFIERIKELSPDVNILIQSVTPMVEENSKTAVTNELIREYNQAMRERCAENGWYYIDVASAVMDENGCLKAEYCSDPNGMKLHMLRSGAVVWADYLLRHVPMELVWHESDFYMDVPEDMWYAGAVRELWGLNILPHEMTFRPRENCTRLEFVEGLYRLHLTLGGARNSTREVLFEDVLPDMDGFDAVSWAAENGITRGVNETHFAPEDPLTREQCCVILMRFATAEGFSFRKCYEATAFSDSLDVDGYARSNVLACQMAGIVNGYEDGTFRPLNSVLRQESATLLQRLWGLVTASAGSPNEGKDQPLKITELVNAREDAYVTFYLRLEQEQKKDGEEIELPDERTPLASRPGEDRWQLIRPDPTVRLDS